MTQTPAPGRFRKLPVEIQAIRWTGLEADLPAARRFLGSHLVGTEQPYDREDHGDQVTLIVKTLHGSVPVEPGCYAAKGERDAWPVDAEQFAATYTPVSSPPADQTALRDRIAAAAKTLGELRGVADYLERRGTDHDDPGLTAAAELLRRVADETAATETQADTATLLELVRDFLDPDPCTFDHHGYCQAHGYLGGEPMSCPHGRAKELLAELEQPAAGARQDGAQP
ncbi:hypothetical protein ABTX71_12860 [Streptomyces parvulus]|uniref:hypothetical protein n=1 Tax=Streptomyces parvulus TaxID=146923 RepID=UPI003323E646